MVCGTRGRCKDDEQSKNARTKMYLTCVACSKNTAPGAETILIQTNDYSTLLRALTPVGKLAFSLKDHHRLECFLPGEYALHYF
jgi:hypothetical protein